MRIRPHARISKSTYFCGAVSVVFGNSHLRIEIKIKFPNFPKTDYFLNENVLGRLQIMRVGTKFVVHFDIDAVKNARIISRPFHGLSDS
jgi:hypothetical protein